MALRIFKAIFGSPAAITPDPLLGAVLVVRRALGVEKKPLDMQRLLYIAQVEHIGQFAAPIFPDIFNATSLGPIIPRLMPLLKRKKAIADPIHETILSQPMMMTLNRIAGEYRSEEHTSELQSLMRISNADFRLKKKKVHHNST